MKKILLAIDATHMDTEVVHFACTIARLTHSTLSGYFISSHYDDEPIVGMAFGVPYIETVVDKEQPAYTALQKKQAENVRLFEKTCAMKGVRCQALCISADYPAQMIIDESRFADLVILHSGTSFEEGPEESPTGFAKEILAQAECPVMVAPLNLSNIDQIVFAYDGSRSAVFAIKQFTYLFPELADKKVIVLQVTDDDTMPVTEKDKLGRLLRMHYSSIGFQVLQGKPSDELFGYLIDKQNTMVVMGAFGRSWLSGLFKPATAGQLLKTINLPFFITHH